MAVRYKGREVGMIGIEHHVVLQGHHETGDAESEDAGCLQAFVPNRRRVFGSVLIRNVFDCRSGTWTSRKRYSDRMATRGAWTRISNAARESVLAQ